VGDKPKAIVVSAFGPSVLVVNSGDGTVSLIDADPRRGTFDRVTKTMNVGSGVTSIVISADGTTAFLASSSGILVVDVAEGAVTKTINLGSGATSIAISADGTILFALGANGFLNLIDIVEGSTTFNEVTKTIKRRIGRVDGRDQRRPVRSLISRSRTPISRWRTTSCMGEPEGLAAAPCPACRRTSCWPTPSPWARGRAPSPCSRTARRRGGERGVGLDHHSGRGQRGAVKPQPALPASCHN
jgi:DNA-binding beta-propeller fold protein YncE